VLVTPLQSNAMRTGVD